MPSTKPNKFVKTHTKIQKKKKNKTEKAKSHQNQVLHTCSDSRSPSLLQPLLLDNEASTNEKARRQRKNQTLDVVSGHALVGVSPLLPGRRHGCETLTLNPTATPNPRFQLPWKADSRLTRFSAIHLKTLTQWRINDLRERKSWRSVGAWRQSGTVETAAKVAWIARKSDKKGNGNGNEKENRRFFFFFKVDFFYLNNDFSPTKRCDECYSTTSSRFPSLKKIKINK